ncbi:unnamed protein product [marine sediment metagenome]|uniref:DUF1559 domain-containing protein n=1 Tax=marine sediment metagenome TaxID=412755 RepID=X0WMS3_9ZZZZ
MAPKVTLDYISSKDGTQNTLLLSERARYLDDDLTLQKGWATTATIQVISPASSTRFDEIEEELGFFVPRESTTLSFPAINQEHTNSATGENEMGVLFCDHPGVVVASFCDGHQSTLSSDIDKTVFLHLMTPAGKGTYKAATDTNRTDAPWLYYSDGPLDTTVLDEADF